LDKYWVKKKRGEKNIKRSLFGELNKDYPKVTFGEGNILTLDEGRKVFDASCGAAVSCLGHGDKRVIEAMVKELDKGTPYVASAFFSSDITEKLCNNLIEGTEGKLARVYLTCSGSEATEAAIKIARQYFSEKGEGDTRVKFITRWESYHGNTLGALSVSGHRARRAPYIPLLMKNVHHISPCNPYRQKLHGETDVAFVARKAAELEAKFQELGPETVVAFIAEPVVGAALGCVPAVPGYLEAMREVCHRHGALFIVDETMCGMGRTGTLHAWQKEGIVPDIQTMGKGLGGGYQPIAAIMVSQKIVDTLLDGTSEFIHGHTYEGMPIQAVAALEIQKIFKEEKLLENVNKQGIYLEKRLRNILAEHPNVGDIRGAGLFWGIEFVKNKISKEPFNSSEHISQKIVDLALSKYDMTVYPGTGSVEGVHGDHIILAPSFRITEQEINYIVDVVSKTIHEVFS